MAYAPVPPGWYPDPENASCQRYWDGCRWLQSDSGPAGQAAYQDSYMGPQPRQGLTRQAKIGWIGIAAVVSIGIVAVVLNFTLVAPSKSYEFGYNEIAAAATDNISVGDEPETLGAIATRACNETINRWQSRHAEPWWWQSDKVLEGCVKYLTEFHHT